MHFARLDSTMQGVGTSFDCLAEDRCDPLGGHSLWASMPPFQAARPTQHLPVTVVAAQSDGLGFFHDDITVRALWHLVSDQQQAPCNGTVSDNRDAIRVCEMFAVRLLGSHAAACRLRGLHHLVLRCERHPTCLECRITFFKKESNWSFAMQGADGPLSGLVAVLAAAQILSRQGDLEQYKRRLIFAAFAGEPWGLMGSKRFLWELVDSSASNESLRIGDIEQVSKCFSTLPLNVLPSC